MRALYLLILIVMGGSVYLVSSGLFQVRRKLRLRYFSDTSSSRQFNLSSVKFLRPLLRMVRPISNLPYLKKLKTQAEILKINLDLPGLVLIKTALALLIGVLVSILTNSLVYGLIALLIGFFVPDFIFLSKIKTKKEAIVRVFPETVDLIDLCIGAGLDFPSSIKWVIDKADPNPFIEQLAIVLSEIQVGRNRVDALKDMAQRLQLLDISSFVRTVIQAERMGTSVEEAFKNLSEDTRSARFQEGERYAIKASLKILFPLLFFILPVIMIVVAGPIIIKFTQGELIPTAGIGLK